MGLTDSKGNELMSWRKANEIHNWFVENIQNGNDDCSDYEVTYEQVEELIETIRQVLDSEELAENLLPTRSGFFFGNTEYDEYYFKDLKDTFETLTEKLKGYSKKNKFIYWSSW